LNRRAFKVALLLAGLAQAPSVFAQADAVQRENAQALYRAGNDARDAGDIKTAAARYEQAFALVPTPVIALAWGKAQIALGQLIEGRQTLLHIRSMKIKPNESPLTSSAREEAASLAAETEARIATVTLKVGTTEGEPPPTLAIDGAGVPAVALNAPWKVNPGSHTVTVTVSGATAETHFSLGEGELKEVVIAVPVSQTPPSPPPDDALRGATTSLGATGVAGPLAEDRAPSRVPAYVALGVGGAGVVVTAVFGALALHDRIALDGLCMMGKSNCPAGAQSDINSLHTSSIASDVGLGVAIAGVAAGGALLFFRRGATRATGPDHVHALQLEPWVGGSVVGMAGSF